MVGQTNQGGVQHRFHPIDPRAIKLLAMVEAGGDDLAHWQRTLAEMRASGATDFASLSVGVESVRKLAD